MLGRTFGLRKLSSVLFVLSCSCTDLALTPTRVQSAAALCEAQRAAFDAQPEMVADDFCGSLLAYCIPRCTDTSSCSQPGCLCDPDPYVRCSAYALNCDTTTATTSERLWCEQVARCCEPSGLPVVVVRLAGFEAFAGTPVVIMVGGESYFLHIQPGNVDTVLDIPDLIVTEGQPVVVEGFLDTVEDMMCFEESSFRIVTPARRMDMEMTLLVDFSDQALQWEECQ